jgi:hypothetical protein
MPASSSVPGRWTLRPMLARSWRGARTEPRPWAAGGHSTDRRPWACDQPAVPALARASRSSSMGRPNRCANADRPPDTWLMTGSEAWVAAAAELVADTDPGVRGPAAGASTLRAGSPPRAETVRPSMSPRRAGPVFASSERRHVHLVRRSERPFRRARRHRRRRPLAISHGAAGATGRPSRRRCRVPC